MAYFGDNEFYQLTEQVKLCENQTRPEIKLEICMVICQMLSTQALDESMSAEIKKMQTFTTKLLTDPAFRRKCSKRQALVEREPITYFGQDTLKGDEFDFDEEFEQKITDIQFKVTTFLGNVMAFIQGEQGV